MLIACGFLGVHSGLHPEVVEGIGLHHVGDVKNVPLSLAGVGDREVVPLRVALGVVVPAEHQVVLEVENLYGPFQVRTLEAGLEDQGAVVVVLGGVVGIRGAFYLLERTGVRTVVHYSVVEVGLLRCSLVFATQALFVDGLFGRVDRLVGLHLVDKLT